jgi:hypothetical protein
MLEAVLSSISTVSIRHYIYQAWPYSIISITPIPDPDQLHQPWLFIHQLVAHEPVSMSKSSRPRQRALKRSRSAVPIFLATRIQDSLKLPRLNFWALPISRIILILNLRVLCCYPHQERLLRLPLQAHAVIYGIPPYRHRTISAKAIATVYQHH